MTWLRIVMALGLGLTWGCHTGDDAALERPPGDSIAAWAALISIFYDNHITGQPSSIACTGSIIAPQVILTAAHCLYATGSHTPLQRGPELSLQVRATFHDGSAWRSVQVVSYDLFAPVYAPGAHPDARIFLGHVPDVALLYLGEGERIEAVPFPSRPTLQSSAVDESTREVALVGRRPQSESPFVLKAQRGAPGGNAPRFVQSRVSRFHSKLPFHVLNRVEAADLPLGVAAHVSLAMDHHFAFTSAALTAHYWPEHTPAASPCVHQPAGNDAAQQDESFVRTGDSGGPLVPQDRPQHLLGVVSSVGDVMQAPERVTVPAAPKSTAQLGKYALASRIDGAVGCWIAERIQQHGGTDGHQAGSAPGLQAHCSPDAHAAIASMRRLRELDQAGWKH